MVVLLSGGVDGNLDSDLAALNFLAVHLRASLLLKLLGTESDETETTALAGLATGLEFLDHEAGDGAESDLGGGGGVVLEDLQELRFISQMRRNHESQRRNEPCLPSDHRGGWQP